VRRKRPKNTPLPSSVIGDIKKEVPQPQLAAIGALALAFNEVEANLDRLFFVVTGLEDHLQLEISTRIYGIDGKIEIISQGAKKILHEQDWLQLTEAMGKGFFGLQKTYRDLVMHARHINPATWVGVKVDRQADVYDFLLDEKTLKIAYDLVVVLRKEFDEVVALIYGLKQLNISGGPGKVHLEAKIAGHQVQYRHYRTERLRLPQMPKFPEEPEVRVAGFQAQQAQTAILNSWYLNQNWDPPPRRRVNPAIYDFSSGPIGPLTTREETRKKNENKD
jgi:hypothetical protein